MRYNLHLCHIEGILFRISLVPLMLSVVMFFIPPGAFAEVRKSFFISEREGLQASEEASLQRLQVYNSRGIKLVSIKLSPTDLTGRNRAKWLKYIELAASLKIKLNVAVICTRMEESWFEKNRAAKSLNTHLIGHSEAVPIWYPGSQLVFYENVQHVVSFLSEFKSFDVINSITLDFGSNSSKDSVSQVAATEFCFFDEFAHKSFEEYLYSKYARISALNKVWHSHYKSWHEIKIPSPYTVRGVVWNDVLLWFRDSKRKFICFQIESMRCALKKFGMTKTRLLMPMSTDVISDEMWLNGVSSGGGSSAIAEMNEAKFLYDLASSTGLGLYVRSNERSGHLTEFAKLKTSSNDLDIWLEEPFSSPDEQVVEDVLHIKPQTFGYAYSRDMFEVDRKALSKSFDEVMQAKTTTEFIAKVTESTSNDRPFNSTGLGIARLDEPWWLARHDVILKRLAAEEFQIVFIGDSITQNWERSDKTTYLNFAPIWKKYFAPIGAINLGFAADGLDNALWRLKNGEISGAQPKIYVLNVGVNDIHFYKKRTQDVCEGIENIIREIRVQDPGAQVLLLGILPTKISSNVTQTTQEVNLYLANKFRKSRFVDFVDPKSAFEQDGVVLDDRFIEHFSGNDNEHLLHPTSEAMAKVAALITPRIQNFLDRR